MLVGAGLTRRGPPQPRPLTLLGEPPLPLPLWHCLGTEIGPGWTCKGWATEPSIIESLTFSAAGYKNATVLRLESGEAQEARHPAGTLDEA